MGLEKLTNYRTTEKDLGFIVDAVNKHECLAVDEQKIPRDTNLRISNRLFIVIDTQEKILLLPPGMPSDTYRESVTIQSRPGWRYIPTPLPEQDKQQWISNKKLGKNSAWDYGLDIEGGAPDWEGVRISLKEHAVWNPMKTADDPHRQLTLPVAVFTAPTYRYLQKALSGIKIPIVPELISSMAHEAGSHLNIMGLVQSWPDGHANDESLVSGYAGLDSLIREYGIQIPSIIQGLVDEMEKIGIAPIGHIHELLAYLTEVVETNIHIHETYLRSASQFLSARNVFGAHLATAIINQLGLTTAAKFGNRLIENMIRDRN